MANENDKGGASEEEFIIDELPADVEEGEEDKTDWKALAKQNYGTLKRMKKALEKSKAKPSESANGAGNEKKGEEKPEGLDKLDKLLLRQEGIRNQDEIDLVQTYVKDSGKTVEQILDSKVFQGELKELRDKKAKEDATPGGSKRSGTSTRDTVDYWLSKGELPPLSDPDLRRKVVNAKIAKEKAGTQFSSNPIQ